MSILGLDIGTSRCKAAIINDDGRAIPCNLGSDNTIPSGVFFNESGEPCFGQDAYNQGLVVPERSVVNWKRDIGTDKVLYEQDGKQYRPKDFAILLIKHLKALAEKAENRSFDSICLSVPANYNDAQKVVMIEAAEACGFSNVAFSDNMTLIVNEPTAATQSYIARSTQAASDGVRAIADIGGGTSDFSIIKTSGNQHQVLTTKGLAKVGGVDYTQTVADYCIQNFQQGTGIDLTQQTHPYDYADVIQRCESAKTALATNDSTVVTISADGQRKAITITRDEALAITKPLTDQIIACLDQAISEAQMTIDDVIELVPVGGGSLFFGVLQGLETYFKKPLSLPNDPHLAIAKGNALAGWSAAGSVTTSGGMVLPSLNQFVHDVTAYSFGVIALSANDSSERYAELLKKNVRIPSQHVRQFALSDEGATGAQITVRQGGIEGDRPDTSTELGAFNLEGLQPVFGKPHLVEVKLSITKNGILVGSAYDSASGVNAELEMSYVQS